MFAKQLRPGAAAVGAAAVAVAVLLGAFTAQAQVNPFATSRAAKGLSKADTDMLFGAAAQLNDTDPLHVGDTKTWNNPATGHGGSVKVMRIYDSGGTACHTLRYDLSAKAHAGTRTYTVDWCKTSSGWRIKS